MYNTLLLLEPRPASRARQMHFLSLLGAKIEKLRETLPDSQKKLFEQFLETMYENNSDYAEAAFARGVSLGVRIVGEAWSYDSM